MALPSQGGRQTAGRRYMFRRHRLPRGPVLFLLLVVVALIVSVYFWKNDQLGGLDPAVSIDKVAMNQTEASDDGGSPTTTKSTETNGRTNESALKTPDFGGVLSSGREVDEQDAGVPTLVMGEPTTIGSSTDPNVNELESSDPASEATGSDLAQSPTPSVEETAPTVSAPLNADDRTPSSPTRASREVQIGLDLIASNQPVEARRKLSQALISGQLSDTEANRVRDELTVLNDRLVFSPEIVPGDPFAISYTIEGGDALSILPRKFGLQVDWRFIQRINRLAKPESIRQGARMKLITGPFHAVVSKKDFRIDIYLGDEHDRVYVCSLPVGLGEFNGTPEGLFVVRPKSKAVNPAWVNPRTGEQFAPDDPMNPIGEYWIGLQGVDESVKDLAGYGIHGTIEPNSIGQERSMGCVRMLPDDIALMYEVLVPHASMIEIRRDA